MTTPFNRDEFLEAISELVQYDKPDDATLATWSTQKKRSLLQKIDGCMKYLEQMHLHIEGIHLPSFVFDLSNPVIAAATIVHRLEQETAIPLPSLRGQRFFGSGVYMLYYAGPFPAYEAISGTTCPIYVGSASPEDKTADTPRKQKTGLYDRLSHHLNKSITAAKTTLDPNDFTCKYLLVQTGLELAAEQFLMRQYHSVWNKEEKVCAGFGKHGDKSEPDGDGTSATGTSTTTTNVGGRKEQSRWDILHPGRPWAGTQVSRKGITPAMVEADIEGHFLKLLKADRARWENIFTAAWVAKHPVSPTTGAGS